MLAVGRVCTYLSHSGGWVATNLITPVYGKNGEINQIGGFYKLLKYNSGSQYVSRAGYND